MEDQQIGGRRIETGDPTDDGAFTREWLALREPVDHRSRAEPLVPPLVEWLGSRARRRVLDLGSGTGSNLRYLAPRLPAGQEWMLVDRNAALLGAGPRGPTGPADGAEHPPGEAPRVRRVEHVHGELDPDALELVGGSDLVTASALLDLVTHDWMERLVGACREAGSAALFALSWDGTIVWSPPDPEDALVAQAVRDHQLGDKGMGPALGPSAAPAAERLFREAGFETRLLPSPWWLEAVDAPLAQALIDGWGAAACEQRPADEPLIRKWVQRRRALDGSGFRLEVGHADLLALP